MFTVLFKAYMFILFGMLITMLNVHNGYAQGFRYMGAGALIALTLYTGALWIKQQQRR
jgi:hypothetical protein